MKISVADLQKGAKRKSKKQTSQGPSKGKAPKAESSSRPTGGVKVGRSTRPTGAREETERRLPRTEEEEEEDSAAQLVHRKRKRSDGGSSHSEARASQDQSGGGASKAPQFPAGEAGVITISPSPPQATGGAPASGAAEVTRGGGADQGDAVEAPPEKTPPPPAQRNVELPLTPGGSMHSGEEGEFVVENRSIHPAELRPSRDLGHEGFGNRSPLSGPRRRFGPGPSSRTYRGDSGLRSPLAAREVVRGMELPRDREIMSQMSWEDIINQSLITVVRHANEIIQLHDMLRASERHRKRSRDSLAEMGKLMDTMSVSLEKAREAHKATEVAEQEARRASERAIRNEEKAKAELVSVRRELSSTWAEVGRLRAEAEVLEAQLEEARRAVSVAESQVSEHIIKARASEAKVRETEAEISDARLRIKSLDDRCSRSRQLLLEHEEEINGLKLRVEEINDELRTVQQNPVITSEMSRRIIDDFKSSEEFFDEVVEGSTDGFSKGFELCRSQVRSLFPDIDVSQLKEFSEDEEDDEEDMAEAEAGEIMEALEKVADSDPDAEVGIEGIPEVPVEAAEAEVIEELPLTVEKQGADEAEKEE